ncbi:Myc-type, basic helix-loop-helix domain-containing protein [Tanacetum coccineum]
MERPKEDKGEESESKARALLYVPPRLQRMFNTKHIAKWMTWHATGQSKENGKMNHPCDGRAWKYFDMMKPEFSGDPRNVRLGLAADETSLMLMMLIPGPRSPAKDIDVYLQPLIKELQELWKGVWTKDAATVRDCCSEELFSLACGPTSACTYPVCIVNGVKFVVHERDILHTTQCSGVSTLGLDGEMYYGQLEEILELTYIGHRKVVLFRCKWFDTINPKNHTTRNRRSYIDQGIHHILTDREFHRNNQYILATQVTQVFYLQDLARQPRGWKVVEHVYHRDVAESDQDVIHGSSSSHVTLSVGLTNLEHTDLSINAQSTEVDAPPVNDDNANANEDNADFINNEDDVVAHVLDDDDVVVSDDDEVNPSTNVEEMACLAPRSHGGDAGGSPPRQPNRPVPAQCQSSSLRIETGNASLRKAFRHNNQQPLTLGFDYDDLGTFHPIGDYASMLNSLMGETIRPLPLACEWEEIPEAFKAHIFPTLESRRHPVQENELLRKQAEEAQQRAYLAALKADSVDQRASVAYQNTKTMYGAVDNARGEDNNESASGEDEEGEQHSSDGDYSSKSE